MSTFIEFIVVLCVCVCGGGGGDEKVFALQIANILLEFRSCGLDQYLDFANLTVKYDKEFSESCATYYNTAQLLIRITTLLFLIL